MNFSPAAVSEGSSMSLLLEGAKSLSTCAQGIIHATYLSVQSYQSDDSSCLNSLHFPIHMYLHCYPTFQTKEHPFQLCCHTAPTEWSLFLSLSGLVLYMQSLLYFCNYNHCVYFSQQEITCSKHSLQETFTHVPCEKGESFWSCKRS